MKRFFVCGILALAGAATLVAQQPGPQPKSQGELDALQAIFMALDPDSRIRAADELILKFADTDFKDLALFIAAASFEQKGDTDKAIIYGERAVEANPRNYSALLLLARLTAQRTREHDLDREEKLGRVEKWVKSANEIVADSPKPNEALSDEEWASAKKDLMAQGHEALGLAALARKRYDVAAAEFKASLENSSQVDPATMVRLGASYNMGGKYDEAIAVLDKVMALEDVHPQIRQFAQAEKVRAVQGKEGGAKPEGTEVAPGTVEIKRP
jgi:tetratricopeptide (TPR) repeat protein